MVFCKFLLKMYNPVEKSQNNHKEDIMENFCKGLTWGLAAGMVAGAIIVSKNKTLSNKIRRGMGIAEEKMQEAKEFIEEKIDESKKEFGCEQDCNCSEYDKNCDEKSNFDKLKSGTNKDLDKKSKNY